MALARRLEASANAYRRPFMSGGVMVAGPGASGPSHPDHRSGETVAATEKEHFIFGSQIRD
jgi:hypothetical protein